MSADTSAEIYDVFLSHNSNDKPAVRELATALRRRNLRVWLDEDDLRPGKSWIEELERGIRASKSVAVLIGKGGLGAWEQQEIHGALDLAAQQKLDVIPVVLPDVPPQMELPMFLRTRTWVDLRPALDPAKLERLVWGITGKKGGVDPELAALLGDRALGLLSHPGMVDLCQLGGFPQHGAALAGQPPGECFEPLVADLHQATQRCLDDWKEKGPTIRQGLKDDCFALLGELIKLAVDKQDREPEELAEIAAASPQRMFVACRRTGTAAAVYCTLANVPLRVGERRPGDRDIGGGSLVDLDGLAQGVGEDTERDVYQAVWLKVKGAPVPQEFDSEDYVEILQDAIEMERTTFHGDLPLLAVRGPREWLNGSGLSSASGRLKIGLVIHTADTDYAYLAVKEVRLINLVCKYLQLLETL